LHIIILTDFKRQC